MSIENLDFELVKKLSDAANKFMFELNGAACQIRINGGNIKAIRAISKIMNTIDSQFIDGLGINLLDSVDKLSRKAEDEQD
ncbi:MAG: hypothetical protein IPP28_16985 [Xanthomonadales bacterium]|nr:hypothetical protein [Xanthomonadales bacterium]